MHNLVYKCLLSKFRCILLWINLFLFSTDGYQKLLENYFFVHIVHAPKCQYHKLVKYNFLTNCAIWYTTEPCCPVAKYARWVLAHIRAHLATGQYGEAAPARKQACELVAWLKPWHGSGRGMAHAMACLRPGKFCILPAAGVYTDFLPQNTQNQGFSMKNHVSRYSVARSFL